MGTGVEEGEGSAASLIQGEGFLAWPLGMRQSARPGPGETSEHVISADSQAHPRPTGSESACAQDSACAHCSWRSTA